MDQKLLREREAKCIQEESPGCTAACPVHVDVRGIVESLRKQDYGSCFKLFQKNVPFPRIISRICDQPCQKGCKRGEIDDPISVNLLERVVVDHNEQPPARKVPVNVKNDKVAVIGAGLSGLTVAAELAKKGYKVAVYEATDRLGGSVWTTPETRLPRNFIELDFLPLKNNSLIEIHFNYFISNEKNATVPFDRICTDYSAVYIGVGSKRIDYTNWGLDLNSQGELLIDTATLGTSHPKVFAGGSLCLGQGNGSPITSISHGKIAVNSIDRLLQNASLTANRVKEGPYETLLYTNIKGIEPQPVVKCADPDKGYSVDEAIQEANRCLLCECMECVKVCEFMDHYRSYPKRYVREVYNNLSIVMGIHHANKMINSCSLCGLCEEVCPNGLDMAEIFKEARRTMVKKGKMPPSAYDFALRDMEFSTGDQFVLNRHQPGFHKSKAVFFPGCQLSASSPDYVKKAYEYLCEKIEGGVGISLGCCGAPAEWAGEELIFAKNLQNIENNWLEMGRPKIITGCPTCYSIFKKNIPQMEVTSIYTVLEEIGIPSVAAEIAPKKLTIHDPCTIRREGQLHKSIRNILQKLGHQVSELENSCQTTECCGYGGLMQFANKELAEETVNRRIKQSNDDYLVYCAMCRDNFVGQGKRVYHLFDLFFRNDQKDRAEIKGPDFSGRHENRARCKTTLLREIWGEQVDEGTNEIKLNIPDDVRHTLENRMILVEDITKVIQYAESTGKRLKNKENNSYIAYYQPVKVTYWVEYTPQEEGFLVLNAYSHRLEIDS
jgi:glutamate synthase (NADPH) small chain